MLAAIAFGGHPDCAQFHRHHHDAELAFKRGGPLHSDHNPDHPEVNPDVRYSLRYTDH